MQTFARTYRGSRSTSTRSTKIGSHVDIFWNGRGGTESIAPRASASRRFHESFPGYAATPLVDAEAVARRLGVRRAFVKDESARLGLPSFKMLGVSWAVAQALVRRAGLAGEVLFESAVHAARSLPGTTLVAATDGNHGHAVARTARLLGLSSRIYVPTGTTPLRVAAIESEDGRVVVVDGSYDDAVARSGAELTTADMLVTAAASAVDDAVPRWMIEGYGTMLREIDEQVGHPVSELSAVAVQIGVGALAAAVVAHVRAVGSDCAIIAVEPHDAACLLASAREGRSVSVAGPHRSKMVGLNCGTPSPAAWPTLIGGVDACIAVEDARADEAVAQLAAAGIAAGHTGAAGLAGLLALADESERIRTRAGLSPDAEVLILCTEGNANVG